MSNYYIDIDVGPDSCGWAVFERNYNGLKNSEKKLRKIRLFETEDATAERESYRTSERLVIKVN